jgi:UDP-N-acetylmuramate dehydrogenase
LADPVSMKVSEHPSLKSLNTIGVDARASLLLEIDSEEDLLSLPTYHAARDLMLGGGSNVLFVGDVPGVVFLNRLAGREVVREDGEGALVEVGAGENWHRFVGWCVDKGFSGVENLALIPGLAGAAPIQNIGAYGVELASVLDSVTAWEWQSSTWVVLDCQQCRFAYRDSLFKSAEPGRYFITSIRLELSKRFEAQVTYPGLAEELLRANVQQPTLAEVYAAVIRLRQAKLPDPAVQGNAGSFFKNPVVGLDRLDTLRQQFPARNRQGNLGKDFCRLDDRAV